MPGSEIAATAFLDCMRVEAAIYLCDRLSFLVLSTRSWKEEYSAGCPLFAIDRHPCGTAYMEGVGAIVICELPITGCTKVAVYVFWYIAGGALYGNAIAFCVVTFTEHTF
jgi:hypothetical protein